MELRPANHNVESELAEEDEDERFDREFRDKLVRETNRKSSKEVTPRSSFSHIRHVTSSVM